MTAFHESPSTGPNAAIANRMQALIPVLQTERLVLRAPRIEDFDAIADLLLGERGKYYGNCQNREEVWGEFIQLTATWFLRGFGAWAVTDKISGRVLGFVHIGAEPGDQEHELGYVVSRDAEGTGVAFEACVAVREYALEVFKLPSLVSYFHEPNKRSVALAHRLGGKRDAKAEAATAALDDACLVFRHAGPEAQ
ncbi:MAG: GNAT family N-acetyltransferase [Pseudomonadota bacterium]